MEHRFVYRIDENSKSQTRSTPGKDAVMILEKFYKYKHHNKNLSHKIKKAIGKWRFEYGCSLIENKNRFRGYYMMLNGLFRDLRSIQYKFTILFFTLIFGVKNSKRLAEYFKTVKLKFFVK